MKILNTLRCSETVNEQNLHELGFIGLMVDNFEYSSFGLNEQNIRDLQVVWFGELLKLQKTELLTDNKSDLKRDIKGSLILNLLSIISSRQIADFENSRSGEQNDLLGR